MGEAIIFAVMLNLLAALVAYIAFKMPDGFISRAIGLRSYAPRKLEKSADYKYAVQLLSLLANQNKQEK